VTVERNGTQWVISDVTNWYDRRETEWLLKKTVRYIRGTL